MLSKTNPSHLEDFSRYWVTGLGLIFLLILGLSFYWVGDARRLQEAGSAIASQRVERGEKIYTQQCSACHSADGSGGVGPALNNRALLKNTLDGVFFSVIRSGVPNTQMPAWGVEYGGPLTDEDIRDVVAYLRSWEMK